MLRSIALLIIFVLLIFCLQQFFTLLQTSNKIENVTNQFFEKTKMMNKEKSSITIRRFFEKKEKEKNTQVKLAEPKKEKEGKLKLYKIIVKTSEKIEYYPYVDIERFTEPHKNEAQISKGECLHEPKIGTDDTLKMIGVTNYIPVDIQRADRSMYTEKLRKIPNEEDIQGRIAEIISCFQSNLNHPFLSRLYVFIQYKESLEFLNSLKFKNSHKLRIVWINKKIEILDELLFISKCLRNQVVIKLHQDNKLGKGFEKVKPSLFLKHNVMYALTRHSPSERHCFYATDYGVCNPKKFSGSHDAFMFYVKEMNETHLQVFNERKIDESDEGMENVFVWIFRKQLKYRVLNPCLVLHVHHEHCIPMRKRHRRRVDKNHSNQANPTNKLF